MANYKTVFSGINGSNRQGDEIIVTQNSIETDLTFDCYNADRTAYTFKSGDVVTASFIERGATGGGYGVTGTITPLIGGSSLTWRRAIGDVGTPGIYNLSFKVVGSDARADWSTPVRYTVQAVAGGDITPPAPLVGVSVSDAAWLAIQSDNGEDVADKLNKTADILSKSAVYELAADDAAKIIECTGTFTLTAPDGLPTGFQVAIANVGTGVITVAATTTLQSKSAAVTLANQYGMATLYHRGSNVWMLAGDLS